MITTTFYRGQGLGNQLWSWATIRCLARKTGFQYGVQAPWRFKGRSFLNIDFGEKVFGIAPKNPTSKKPLGIQHYYVEERKMIGDIDVSGRDIQLEQIKDNTKIDGVFQCEDYIHEFKDEITKILFVRRPKELDENTCVIHIRGGDFKGNQDLLLSANYYRNAISLIKDVNRNAKFVACTNDKLLAKEILKDLSVDSISPYLDTEIFSGPDGKIDVRVSSDFALLQHADYLITANSSFSWWGAWTNKTSKMTIAPKYWARHNLNGPHWSTQGIITRDWLYLDTMGKLSSYDECIKELN